MYSRRNSGLHLKERRARGADGEYKRLSEVVQGLRGRVCCVSRVECLLRGVPAGSIVLFEGKGGYTITLKAKYASSRHQH